MKNKKWIALLLTGALALSTAACGNASDGDASSSAAGTTAAGNTSSVASSTAEATGEPVTLRVLSANEAIDETMMQEFMDANPNIKIEYEYVSAADAPTKLAALATANDLPDVFQTQSAMYVDLVKEGMLMDLTDALNTPSYEGDKTWAETYDTALLGNSENILKTGCGEMDTYSYGVPFAMTTVAVLYDQTIYENLNLEVPTTWDEFVANLEALKAADYSAIAVQNNTCLDWFPRLFWDQYCRDELETQGLSFADGTMTFNSDSVKEGLIQYKKLYDAGYFQESYLTDTLEMTEQLFLQGKLAQLMVTTDKIKYLLDNKPESMKLASYALPGINGLPSRSLGGASVILTANKDTEHPEEAVTLLKYLTSRTNFSTNEKLQLSISGLQGVTLPEEYAVITKGYGEAAAAGFCPEVFVPTNITSEMNTTFRGDQVQNYLLGNYTLEQVCQTMQDMYDEYLESVK